MAVLVLLLALVLTLVNGRPDAQSQDRDDTIQTTHHCRFTVHVLYQSEDAPPYAHCSTWCPGGELWTDGVMYRKLPELLPYNLMVEVQFINGTLDQCTMVPLDTVREDGLKKRMGSCSPRQNVPREEDNVIVESVTELIPGYSSTAPHRIFERFTRVGDAFYQVSRDAMTYREAISYCRQIGGSLAFVESAGEQNALQGVLAMHVWIGLDDIAHEGVFKNEFNTPITYSSWDPNQPDDHRGNEDCGMLSADHSYNWNDFPCNDKIHALCEHPLVEDHHQYTCPHGFFQRDSSCYFVTENAHPYDVGMGFCIQKGAYPVFINSREEQDFLAEKMTGDVYIGHNDKLHEGRFISDLYGLSFFTNWKPGQPDNHNNDEDCGMILSDSWYQWNDIPCHMKIRMLCEKVADIVA